MRGGVPVKRPRILGLMLIVVVFTTFILACGETSSSDEVFNPHARIGGIEFSIGPGIRPGHTALCP